MLVKAALGGIKPLPEPMYIIAYSDLLESYKQLTHCCVLLWFDVSLLTKFIRLISAAVESSYNYRMIAIEVISNKLITEHSLQNQN